MSERITLADLPTGSTGTVLGYVNGPSLRRRFADMGLVPGTRVTRLRTAPFGDPSSYAVFGTRVAIRSRDASKVLVELVTA
jgi:Fe2+ transport system protein FeoA